MRESLAFRVFSVLILDPGSWDLDVVESGLIVDGSCQGGVMDGWNLLGTRLVGWLVGVLGTRLVVCWGRGWMVY